MVVINGPRFSTRAESRWFRQMGWHVVNMTGYPEAVLAAELGIRYATVALVTDHDAGRRRDRSGDDGTGLRRDAFERHPGPRLDRCSAASTRRSTGDDCGRRRARRVRRRPPRRVLGDRPAGAPARRRRRHGRGGVGGLRLRPARSGAPTRGAGGVPRRSPAGRPRLPRRLGLALRAGTGRSPVSSPPGSSSPSGGAGPIASGAHGDRRRLAPRRRFRRRPCRHRRRRRSPLRGDRSDRVSRQPADRSAGRRVRQHLHRSDRPLLGPRPGSSAGLRRSSSCSSTRSVSAEPGRPPDCRSSPPRRRLRRSAVTVRCVGGRSGGCERCCRFSSSSPYALWQVTSADAVFTAVAAGGVAALVTAMGARTRWRAIGGGAIGGLLLGGLLFLTYLGAIFGLLVVGAVGRVGSRPPLATLGGRRRCSRRRSGRGRRPPRRLLVARRRAAHTGRVLGGQRPVPHLRLLRHRQSRRRLAGDRPRRVRRAAARPPAGDRRARRRQRCWR